jgi:glutamine cyclotransferase
VVNVFVLVAVLLLSRAGGAQARSAQPREYSFRVVHIYPHDPSAFTQGLEYRGGYLYEGTGLPGRSTLRKEELETGKVLEEVRLASEFFGEGITVLNTRVLQLTWQSHIGFVYDQNTFRKLSSFAYSGEGWGLANDGTTVFMSDGTPQIRCLDPTTLLELRRFTVHDANGPVSMVNELECVRGEIYANIWHSRRIARIAPSDGSVVGWIDLKGLIPDEELHDPEAVLNGIAYDAMGDRLFVTGKLWPKLFEIKVIPKWRAVTNRKKP